MPPQTMGTLTASVQGLSFLSVNETFSVNLARAASVKAVLRTTTVYADSADVRVAYQVRDAAGRVLIDATGVEVTLLISDNASSVEPVSVSCASPGVGAVGLCSATLASGWFSDSATGTATVQVSLSYSGALVATAAAGSLTRARWPVHDALSGAGMLAQLVAAPVFPGDAFDVAVRAHTDGFALKRYSFQLLYDAEVVEYVGVTGGSLYAAPSSVAVDEIAGQVSILVIDVAEATGDEQVTGTAVELLSFQLRVRNSTAGSAVYSNVTRLVITSMVNSADVDFLPVHLQAGLMLDRRDGSSFGGELEVATLAAVGAHAYTAATELVNTAPLTGEAVTTQVTVVEHYNRAASASATMTSAYACSSTNTSVFDVDAASCLVSLTASQTAGAASTMLEVVSTTNGNVTAQTPLRVWFPVAASVQVADGVLDAVTLLQQAAACAQPGYQTSALTLVADFGGAGLTTVSDLDVTSLATFASSNAAVASVSGAMVTGLTPGVATVTLGGGAIITLAEASVSVTPTEVNATLTVVAATAISWASQPPSSLASALEPIDVAVTSAQVLQLDGDTAGVYAFVTFSDGSTYAVPPSQLVVTSRSTGLELAAGSDSAPWKISVLPGAFAECGDLIMAQWEVCGATVVSGFANIFLDRPKAGALLLSSERASLTVPDDAAAKAPVSTYTESEVRVRVEFATSNSTSVVDYTADVRVERRISPVSAACAYMKTATTVAMFAGSRCKTIEVNVYFQAFAISDTLVIPVVYLQGLAMIASPFPSYGGSTAKLSQTLHKIDCTGYYQHATATAIATLTDASAFHVTSHTVFNSSDSAVISVDATDTARLRANAAGSATVVGAWASKASDPFVMTVTDSPATISSIDLRYPLSTSKTLFGPAGTAKPARVQVYFDDGTQFTNFFSRVDWIPTSDLLLFNSSAPTAASISTQGVITLHDNHYERIAMVATSACSVEVTDTEEVAANLEALNADVDLGSLYGVHFEQVGDTLMVPVRINANGLLKNFQIDIDIDDSVFEAAACDLGAQWTGLFSCTRNDPTNKITIVGNDADSTVTGANVEVAVIYLTVKSSALSALSGLVVELVQFVGTAEQRVSSTAVSAGDGFALVTQSPARRLAELRSTVTRERDVQLESLPQRRRLSAFTGPEIVKKVNTEWAMASNCSDKNDVLGDLDGDSSFSSYDVFAASIVFDGIALGSVSYNDLCPVIQQRLNANLDSVFGMSDLRYLLLTAARKLHFVSNVNTTADAVVAGSTGELGFFVTLRNSEGVAVTSQVGVRAELSYKTVEGTPTYAVGATLGASPDGYWLAQLEHVGDGVFAAAVHAAPFWLSLRTIGIAFMLETTDAQGGSEDDRNVAFFGSSAEPYASLGSSFSPYFEPRAAAAAPAAQPAAAEPAAEPAAAELATEPATEPAAEPAAAEPAAQPAAEPAAAEPAAVLLKASATGPGFAVDGSAAVTNATFSREFGFFNRFPPLTTGTVTASLQGTSFLALSQSVSMALSQVASVEIIMRTATVYADSSRVRVAYQARDSARRTSFLESGLAVLLRVELDGEQEQEQSSVSATATCTAADAGGIGLCTVDLGSSFFSTALESSATVTVSAKYGQTTVATASLGSVALARSPVHAVLSSAGVLAQMPASPVFAGDTFTVAVRAHTSGASYALMSFALLLEYNSSVLGSPSVSGSSLYSQPLTSVDAAVGRVSVNVLDTAGGVSSASVTGTNIALITVTFTVLSSAPAGVYSDVLSITATSFVNAGSITFLSDAAGIVLDHRDGSYASGELAVEAVAAVGAHAYAASAELVNTAPLTGEAVTTQVTVVEHYNRAASASATMTSAYACSAADATMAMVNSASCLVSLTASQTAGAASVAITATSTTSAVSAQAELRVWFPVAASLHISDSSLQRVEGLMRAGSCEQSGYQTGELTLVADFGGEGLTTVSDLDVTSLATFASSNAAVASVLGAMVTGLSAGVVTVTLGNGATAGASTAVDVNSNFVSVTIKAIAISSLLWGTQQPLSVAASAASEFTTSVTIAQVLTLEGDRAGVYAWAHYSDGSYAAVASSELVVTSNTDYLTMASGSPWILTVAAGARRDCGEFVDVSWQVCGATVAEDSATVTLAMPRPFGITVSSSKSRLAAPGDPSTFSPISVATSATIQTVVDYDTGATFDITGDVRQMASLTTESAACATISNGNRVTLLAGATCTSIGVLVALDGFGGLVGSVVIPVVHLQQLTVLATPYPTYSGSTSKVMSTLHKIGCTAHYQHATPAAYATLTDATQYAVTSVASFASGASPVISTSGSGNKARLHGTSMGVASITATFAGVVSEAFEIAVSDDTVTVSSLQLTVGGLSGASTLYGPVNTTKDARVQVLFDDGTQFTNFFTRVDWIPTSDLLAFTSSTPTAASISTQGVITLHDNHYKFITMTVISACDSEKTSSKSLAANLAAGVGDVDLGNELGVQFDQAGNTIEVPVRVNANGLLKNFHIDIDIDDSVFDAAACDQGANWGGLWSCTLNDPANKITIIGNDADSAFSGSELEVAIIYLTVKSSGLSQIGGSIVELTQYVNDVEQRSSVVTPIAAGAGPVSLAQSQKRRLSALRESARIHQEVVHAATPQRRQLLSSFTSADIVRLVETEWQMTSDCDATND
ncbi:hypothetical protein T492DRAFT_910200, partial [Pavlovales sp. CCMP2436]